MARGTMWTKLGLALGAALLTVPTVSHAQFSDGYKFLEAVKKADGDEATKFLNKPGTTIVNARDVTSGQTGLHIAVARRDMRWTRFLIEGGARVNDANDTGETPLISAVHQKDIGIMRALLKAGANPDRPDNSGRSAREYARLQGATSATLAEIEARAKPGASGDAGAGPVYGPRF